MTLTEVNISAFRTNLVLCNRLDKKLQQNLEKLKVSVLLRESEENNSPNILPDANSCMYFKCFLYIFGVCYSIYVFKKRFMALVIQVLRNGI